MRRRDQMQETVSQERETEQSIGERRKRLDEAEPKKCQEVRRDLVCSNNSSRSATVNR